MMTSTQKRTVLQRIQTLEQDIEGLRAARMKAAESGFASASIASGGGSKSYTRLDIAKISELIQQLTSELKSTKALLAGDSASAPSYVYQTWF